MIGSGFMKNYAGLVVTRLMIGLCEAGMFPYLNVYREWSQGHKEIKLMCLSHVLL